MYKATCHLFIQSHRSLAVCIVMFQFCDNAYFCSHTQYRRPREQLVHASHRSHLHWLIANSAHSCLLLRSACNQRPACAMPKIPERSWLFVLFFIHCNADRCAVRALCRATNALGESARKDVQNRCNLKGWKLIRDAIAMISFWAPKGGQCRAYCRGAINQVAKAWLKVNLWVYHNDREKTDSRNPMWRSAVLCRNYVSSACRARM